MMKRALKIFLLLVCVIIFLTGCSEEVLLPTDAGDFGLTMEQFIEGLEESRLWRIEAFGDNRDLEAEKESLVFKKKEIEDIEKYTVKNAGIAIDVFCSKGKIYCVKLSGDANKQNMAPYATNLKIYGEDIEKLLNRDWHTPRADMPDRFDTAEWMYMFDLSDGQIKDLEGEGIVYHAERKGNRFTAIFTPTEDRKKLGENH